jgi:hypothetical protein
VDPDPDLHQIESYDPNPHQSDKLDPEQDPHQFEGDKLKCMEKLAFWSTIFKVWAFIEKLGSGSASWRCESATQVCMSPV